jgi:transcriptional regulator with GAF, ATPase, and Fis domain
MSKVKADDINRQAWELNRKDPRAAIELANQALELSRSINYDQGEAGALRTLGACNVWLSNNENAFTLSQEAFRLYKRLGDLIKQAQVAYNLGTNFYYLSDYDNALKYYSLCLRLNEDAGHEPGMSEGLNGLGTVYYTIEQNEKAIEVLLKALEICKNTNDPEITPRVLDGLGEAFYNLKEYDRALEHYFSCIDALRKSNYNPQVAAFAYDGLGRAFAAKGDFKKALEHYDESIRIRREIGFRVGEATSLINIGKLFHLQGLHKEALKHYQDALKIAGEINSTENIYKASEGCAAVAEETGDLKTALEHFRKFHKAKEEVRDEKSARRSRSIEMQFRMEKAETEKQLLEAKNKELQNFFNNVVLLNDIGKAIASSLSVDEIVETVYANVNQLMDAAGFGIGLLQPDGKEIVFPLYIEENERLRMIHYDLNDKNRLAVHCFENNREIVINDFRNEVNQYISVVQKPIAGRSISSLIYLPLEQKGKKIGVITVQSFNSNAFSEHHVGFLRSIAVNAAIALENALLYKGVEETVRERTEEIQRAYENTRLLSELGQQITSSLDFDSIFGRLHHSVKELMSADCFGVRILHADKNEVEYKFEIEGEEKLEPMTVSMNDDDNYSVWCIKNRKPIFINDNLTEYSKYTSQIKVVSGDMPHSLIFFPLTIGEKIIGVITVQSFRKHAYLPYHLDILRTLASYTAIAFENANLYENLEEKVKERTAEVVKQKAIIEEKNKDITDSIFYAKKIQQAILPDEREILQEMPDSFVFYKPKDIVSGDFYWYAAMGELLVFAVADCTGHGVPGAFMSAICNDLMNQVIRDGRVTTPGMALQLLDIKLQQLLRKSGEVGANDGMDIALCTLNTSTNVLQYAGANRPLIILRKGELQEFRATRVSIGGYNTGRKQFIDHEIDLQKDDAIYLFSDGYADQFGGPRGKKFKYKQLCDLLRTIQHETMQRQKEILDETIDKWRAELEQVDDILMIGLKVQYDRAS